MRISSLASTLSLAALACVAHVGCDDASTTTATPPGADGGTFEPTGDGGATPGPAGPVLTACPDTSSGAGTEHAREITADETWSAAGSPHRVTFGIRVLATVTIEPCATVLVGDSYTVTIGTTGKKGAIVAKGERGVDASGAPIRRPVTFGAIDPSKPWGSLTVDQEGMLDLSSAVLRDAASAASDQNGGGAILAYGEASTAATVVKNVRAVDLTIERARGHGVSLQRRSAFTDDSKDVVVKDSGREGAAFPIRVVPGAMTNIPTGVVLMGNHADEIEILASSASTLTDTIRSRGAPYRVSGRLRVAPETDGPAATLTIEPGVTLRFDTTSDSGLQIGTSDARQGILVAAGTVAAPITFTSAKSPAAPGDWKNIYFGYSPPAGNRIENAVIEYAGGSSGAQGYGCGDAENDASVLLLSARPTDAFIKTTTFRNGGGDTGIVLGWTSDLAGPDFKATNTFTSMPTCEVSRWRNATGETCPGSTNGSPVCL